MVVRVGNHESSPNQILWLWIPDRRSLRSLVRDDERRLTLRNRSPDERSDMRGDYTTTLSLFAARVIPV
ncbi:hypothetical protein GCM10007857_73280 [Bradyrhizobium iriomotense]|uniref:Uncharacterized protein n=1 Tax=Bradyrhizobium iriomotense TaxID=441950 RepID=A0ABQ6B985_9BRAD|nr:hypothetical protein GCM10007857_73280 [Bradyrhizobium iriomotense]